MCASGTSQFSALRLGVKTGMPAGSIFVASQSLGRLGLLSSGLTKEQDQTPSDRSIYLFRPHSWPIGAGPSRRSWAVVQQHRGIFS